MQKRLSQSELHEFIGRAVARPGYTSTVPWHDPKEQFEGYGLKSLYTRLHKMKRDGKPFAGYGSWDNYLEKHHRLKLTDKWRLSKDEVHDLIWSAIQITSGGAPENLAVPLANWRYYNRPVLDGRTLQQLWVIASRHKVGGRGFFGYGTWEKYLEEKHGVVSLYSSHWSDERLHYAVALLAKKYPPEKVNWTHNERTKFYGRALSALYNAGYRNNGVKSLTSAERFFGHGTFKKYAEWAVKNYSSR